MVRNCVFVFKEKDITSQDVNDYLREITGEDFTAKDIRTWAGTVLAAIALNAAGGFEQRNKPKQTSKMQSARSQKYLETLRQFVKSVTLILLCSKVISTEILSKV
jgi:DNA topoisomerase IB